MFKIQIMSPEKPSYCHPMMTDKSNPCSLVELKQPANIVLITITATKCNRKRIVSKIIQLYIKNPLYGNELFVQAQQF